MAKRVSVGKRLAHDMAGRLGSSEAGRGGVESLFKFFGITDSEMVKHGFLLTVISTLEYEEAQKIAREVVKRKKAMRADIMPRVSSVLWNGEEVEETEESFVLVMTKEDLFADLVKVVKRVCGKNIPEIVALPILRDGSGDVGEKVEGTELEVTLGEVKSKAWLYESDTAARVLEALPMTSSVNVWGDEIYFSVPITKELENGKSAVNLGDIAYWPPAKAVCIFLGQTPISNNGIIKPLTPVEVIGKVENPEALLKQVRQGQIINLKC